MPEKNHLFSVYVFWRFRWFFVFTFIKCKQIRKSPSQNFYAKWGFHPELYTKFQLYAAWNNWENPSDVSDTHTYTNHVGSFPSLMESQFAETLRWSRWTKIGVWIWKQQNRSINSTFLTPRSWCPYGNLLNVNKSVTFVYITETNNLFKNIYLSAKWQKPKKTKYEGKISAKDFLSVTLAIERPKVYPIHISA